MYRPLSPLPSGPGVWERRLGFPEGGTRELSQRGCLGEPLGGQCHAESLLLSHRCWGCGSL